MSETFLKASAICKEFKRGSHCLKVLNNLDLEIKKQDAICITGPSGAGKSTFLHILGLLDQPTSGFVFYKNRNLCQASEEIKTQFRRNQVGFVFQFHYLLSEFNAIENVMIAGQIAGWNKTQSKMEARRLMEIVGLQDREFHFPNELSGGEQQRVALARALMNQPEILFADEPTGNLDTQNSMKIVDILFELRERFQLTLVTVSHDSHFSKCFPKILSMKDGCWV